MNRTRYIPAIVMLLAAFVACIATIYFEYSTKDILLIVLATSVVFFILGLFIKMIAEKYLVIDTMTEVLDEENKDEAENKEENEESVQEKQNK